jgi:sulfotransferase family protein
MGFAKRPPISKVPTPAGSDNSYSAPDGGMREFRGWCCFVVGELEMSGQEGPDFICIGMPKAGTGWLFDQLQYHPDFWMPPVKELHYLNRDTPRMRNVSKRLERAQQRGDSAKEKKRRKDKPRRHKIANRRPGDERDLRFLEDAGAARGQPMDLARYASLFRHKGELLSGDISPGYCQLSDEVIQRIASGLPEAKIVLLVRDPVARAWSRINMSYRDGKFDERLVDDPDGFRRYLEGSDKIQRRSLPSRIVENWQRCAPQLRFRHFLFDDIVDEPEKARAEILTFLGADPAKKSGELSAGYNRKASAKKLTLTADAKAVLVDHFRNELKFCAELFGGHARKWAANYGV